MNVQKVKKNEALKILVEPDPWVLCKENWLSYIINKDSGGVEDLDPDNLAQEPHIRDWERRQARTYKLTRSRPGPVHDYHHPGWFEDQFYLAQEEGRSQIHYFREKTRYDYADGNNGR